jgi:ribosomal protein L21
MNSVDRNNLLKIHRILLFDDAQIKSDSVLFIKHDEWKINERNNVTLNQRHILSSYMYRKYKYRTKRIYYRQTYLSICVSLIHKWVNKKI